MQEGILILGLTAASVGLFHTLAGPDHYLPFVMMARARSWSFSRTLWITFVCGLGHVLSSVLLGGLGLALGIAVGELESLEAVRGNLAAWAMIAFGFAYFIWGLRYAMRQQPHVHGHFHAHGVPHRHDSGVHEHGHDNTPTHERASQSITPWALFVIFVLGPCEPLIPVLMYPAAKMSLGGVAFIAFVFCAITILTMMVMVSALLWGVALVFPARLERHVHSIAGGTICLSGLAIQCLGL